MPPTVDPASTLTCAKCGIAQPLTAFDQRFIGKSYKVTCATCRGLATITVISKPPETLEERKARLREQLRRCREEEERRRQREAILHEIAARQQQMLHQGFTERDIGAIREIHFRIRKSGNAWSDIKRIYASLVPPCTDELRHPCFSATFRQAVYNEQQGHCFYCRRELLSLDVWKRGSKDGRSVIDDMTFAQRHNGADSGIPELDHQIPIARGGNDARDNLCYACRKCNQSKGLRTLAEFSCYPNDPISQMNMGPALIRRALECEQRGYDKFDVIVPD